MKRKSIDSRLQKLNDIYLTEQESSEIYDDILSKVDQIKKRNKISLAFKPFITSIATIVFLMIGGWFIYDTLNPSINRPGDEAPAAVDDHMEEDEQIEKEEANHFSDTTNDDPTDERADNKFGPSSRIIFLYFEWNRADERPYPVKPVYREAEIGDVENQIEFAVQELIQGPTEEERDAGFESIFNEETAGLLHGIELQTNGHIVIDFVDFSNIIPSSSASAASLGLMESLNMTVSQFSEVKTIEYRFDDSCEKFFDWIQMDCTVYEADDYIIHVRGTEFDTPAEYSFYFEQDEIRLVLEQLPEDVQEYLMTGASIHIVDPFVHDAEAREILIEAMKYLPNLNANDVDALISNSGEDRSYQEKLEELLEFRKKEKND